MSGAVIAAQMVACTGSLLGGGHRFARTSPPTPVLAASALLARDDRKESAQSVPVELLVEVRALHRELLRRPLHVPAVRGELQLEEQRLALVLELFEGPRGEGV